jgi:uncharacterized lipoprotein
VKAVAAALAVAILAGCASDPRYAQGLEWVVWNEQEKVRLEAQGFTQYAPGSDR